MQRFATFSIVHRLLIAATSREVAQEAIYQHKGLSITKAVSRHAINANFRFLAPERLMAIGSIVLLRVRF